MSARAVLYLATRFLFGRRDGRPGRIRSAVVAVGLSLVPLVLVLQVSDGMIQGITSRFIEAGTYHLQAIGRDDLTLEQVTEIADRIAHVPGVQVVIPERQGIGLLYSDTSRAGATVRAVSPDIWERDAGFRTYVELEGGVFDLSTEQSVVLGVQLARQLSVGPGDAVRLLTVRPGPGGAFLPRISSFVVTGVVSTGYQDLDRLWVYVPLERGMQILAPGTARQIIGIKVDHPYRIANPIFSPRPDAATAAMVRGIAGQLDGQWRLFSWYDLERSRYLSFVTTRNLLLFIMVLIVCVASVNISSAMVMLIIEKQPEIAILKSVGAQPGAMAAVFVLCGFFAGVVGAAIGVTVGLLASITVNEILAGIEGLINLAAGIGGLLASPFGITAPTEVSLFHAEFYLERLPVVLSFPELAAAAALAIALSTVAAWIPARRAAGIRPIDVMRRH